MKSQLTLTFLLSILITYPKCEVSFKSSFIQNHYKLPTIARILQHNCYYITQTKQFSVHTNYCWQSRAQNICTINKHHLSNKLKLTIVMTLVACIDHDWILYAILITKAQDHKIFFRKKKLHHAKGIP